MMKVLVCDDQKKFSEMLNKDLTAAGMDVVVCENGWDALVELGKSKFDAAIIDIEMPKVNGLDLVRILAESKNDLIKRTKLIVCTAHDSEWNRGVAWSNSVLVTIPKPYKLPELLNFLR